MRVTAKRRDLLSYGWGVLAIRPAARITIWLTLWVLLLSGCSANRLDTQTATNAIRSRFKTTESSIVADIGRVSSHCVSFVENGLEHEIGIQPPEDINVVVALKAGYLTASPDGSEFWKVGVTDKGNAAHDSNWSNSDYRNQQKGCDYRYYGFVVARPELVRVTAVHTDGPKPTADYEFKWVPTELGIALRQDGAIYSQLTGQQRIQLSASAHHSSGLEVPLPVPPEGRIQTQTAVLEKTRDGWVAMALNGRDE